MKRLTKYLEVFLVGLILASPVMMVLPLQNEAHAATWGELNGYSERRTLSFNVRTLSENLTNFVVDVFLDSTKADFSLMKANGADIRFVDKDDATVLPTDNISWNGTAQTAHFQVAIPQIDAYSTYTDYFYLYYGNPAASASFNSTAVWASTGAVAVYNLSDVRNNGANITNAVSTNYSSVSTNTTTWSSLGRVFNGANFLQFPAISQIGLTQNFTIMGWAINNQPLTVYRGLVAATQGGTNRWGITTNNAGGFEFGTYNGTDGNRLKTSGIVQNTWFNFDATMTSNSTNNQVKEVYVNSVAGSSNAGSNSYAASGITYIGVNAAGPSQFWSGTIGEVRMYGRTLDVNEMLYSRLSSMYAYTGVDGGIIYYGGTNPQPTITTVSSSPTMDKDGNVSVNLTGNMTTLGGLPRADEWFKYGLTNAYGNNTLSQVISINATDHVNYGMSYPVTYIYRIPSTAVNMSVTYRKSLSANWSNLTTKVSTDLFNGIEAVRFDYTNDKAFVSVAFGSSSDNIYLRFYESGVLQTDNVYFLNIAQYYDDRVMAVVFTSDDWSTAYATQLQNYASNLTARNIVGTGAVITGAASTNAATWTIFQNLLNTGFIEIASHSRTHGGLPFADYDSEIQGSKQDITGNLTLPSIYTNGSNEYVPAWVEPGGASDATERLKLGQYHYLADRNANAGAGFNAADSYALWDSGNSTYARITPTVFTDSNNSSATLNAAFDEDYSARGIYINYSHPWDAVSSNMTTGSAFATHMDYVGNRKDVWYVGLGALYMYHYATNTWSSSNSNHVITTGTYVNNITGLTPGQTYHYQSAGANEFGTSNGSDSTFTLTLPSVTTGTPTNVGMNSGTHATLNAEITSMGVATDTYTSFQYSTDLSFSQSTPEVVQGAIGTYSATINGFLPNQFYNVRAVNRVGAVYSYGATQTFFTNATATFNLLDTTIILVVVALIFFILSMILLPAETPFIFRMILIAVATYFVLAILPGLQNILSALQ